MSDSDDLQDIEDFIDFVRRAREQGPRRYLRDLDDPFTKYSVQEFFARYRFTPHVVKNSIIPMVESDLKKPTNRGLPFAPEIMVLVSLRYYATGSVQKLGGDFMDIRQQSVSRIVATVSVLLATKMKNVVKFPSTPEGISLIKQKFYEIGEFPGIVGCLGCTHIKIKSPGGNTAKIFKNRKGWYSVNVQAVAGPDLTFFNLVARWPGSTHNSFIYNSSSLKQTLNSGELEGILLGDNGYAVSPVLMTPFLSPNNAAQERYNRSQVKTRRVIEQAFEVWKRRFPCLQCGMGVKLKTVIAVICACATLHNLAIICDDILEPHLHHDSSEDAVQITTEDSNSSGFIARDAVVQNFFQ